MKLTAAKAKLTLFDLDTKVKFLVSCQLIVTNPKTCKRYTVEFHDLPFRCIPILGCRAILKMRWITVDYGNFQNVNVDTELVNTVELDCKQENSPKPEDSFSSVFEGQDTIQGEIHLQVDMSVSMYS